MTGRRLSLAIWLASAAAASQGSAPAVRSGPAAFRPPPRDEAYDAAADRKRDQLIEELRAFLSRTSERERKAELTFQLAELWWEKARFASLQEVKEFDTAHERWSADRKGEEPKIDARKSEGYKRNALQLYQEVLDGSPAYPRRDEVLFVAGYNLAESGRKGEAMRKYRELIEGYPKSRFVPDAHVQMGEQLFAANDLAGARAAYEKAAAYRLPKLYPFAIYKLAWCDYNAGDPRSAIAKFQKVVSYSEAQGGATAGDRIQLANEALKDMVLPYTQLDAIDEAVAYLREKGGERRSELVDRLAGAYFEAGKFEQAIRVYRMLQTDDPRNVRAPSWQQKILLAYDKLNRREQVAAEMKKLVSEYGPRGAWARAHAGQQGALAEAGELTETAVRDIVQDYHHEAVKTKNAATYRLARDMYRQYLEAFPLSDAAYQMRFYYAEILYSLEEWDEAAAQYGLVAEANPRGESSRKAAYDAILALDRSVAVSRGTRKKRELSDAAKVDAAKSKGELETGRAPPRQGGTKSLEPGPLSGNEQKLIEACERYLRVAPGAKDEILVRYKAALVFYEHLQFAEAARRFEEIIGRWPQDAWAQKAAELSLDILNQREEWVALGDLARRYLQNDALAPKGSTFEKEVARIGEGARFKAVMQIHERKDYALAAREFRGFVAEYPHSQYAPKALYNALVIADQADQLDVEIAAGEELVRQHPDADPEILKLTIPALASACERSGHFRAAIRWYEEAFARWPSDPHAADWLYEAALQRELSGDDAASAVLWERYLHRFGNRPDAPRVAFDLGMLYERQKRWPEAAAHWGSFPRRWKSATAAETFLAAYRHGLALRAQRSPQAAQVLGDLQRRYAVLPKADREKEPILDAAAHAAFLAADRSLESFTAIDFRSTRQRDLVGRLKLKNARLAGLLSSYARVVGIGSPRWSEAAFTRIGEAYRNFNKGLLDAPMPRRLTAEQEELYRRTLGSQALPLEDKAVEAFRKAMAVAEKSGVYSEWLLKSQELLREYQPDSFADVHKPALVNGTALARIAPAIAVEPPGGSR